MTNPIVVESIEQGRTMHYYWCSGCDKMHGVEVGAGGWEFTGTMECPTYSPSVLVTRMSGPEKIEQRCHTFIRNGIVEFLSDCTHALAGTSAPLPPVPDWLAEQHKKEPLP